MAYKWWMRFWPSNPWAVPRFIPFYTKWATRRWHQKAAEAISEGFKRGMHGG